MDGLGSPRLRSAAGVPWLRSAAVHPVVERSRNNRRISWLLSGVETTGMLTQQPVQQSGYSIYQISHLLFYDITCWYTSTNFFVSRRQSNFSSTDLRPERLICSREV